VSAVTENGKLWTWGSGGSGRLGHGNTEYKVAPEEVRGGLPAICAVHCGTSHTLALSSDATGTVYAFGSGLEGQLGTGLAESRFSPVKVRGLPRARSIACGSYHSAALSHEDRLFTWGRGESGQLGTGTTKYEMEPVEVLCVKTGIASIACGPYQTAVVTVDGSAFMCGHNASGQLGNGSTDTKVSLCAVAAPGTHRIPQHRVIFRQVNPQKLRKWFNGQLWIWNPQKGEWVICLACEMFKKHTCFCKDGKRAYKPPDGDVV
jgi:alpha-tubulin suppressor-like RCC1 family protein